MFDVKIKLGLIIIDVVLYLIGILFWFNETFAHLLGVVGFFPRFFAGLAAIGIGIVIIVIVKN